MSWVGPAPPTWRLTASWVWTRVTGVSDVGSAYAEVQRRMTALVASLSSDELALGVPACPAWTVQDLVAHHGAVVADFASGSTTELGDLNRLLDQNCDSAVAHDRDTLTARLVHERRGRSVDAILRDWRAATADILPMLRRDVAFPD